jgi:hypothetical protein
VGIYFHDPNSPMGDGQCDLQRPEQIGALVELLFWDVVRLQVMIPCKDGITFCSSSAHSAAETTFSLKSIREYF